MKAGEAFVPPLCLAPPLGNFYESDDMDFLGSMVMPEALLIAKAFDQQGPWPIKFQFTMHTK